MTHESQETQGVVELATDTWKDVCGTGGEVEIARQVIGYGLRHAYKLRRQNDLESLQSAKHIELLVRDVQDMIAQRERTAHEFLNDLL